MSQHDMQKARQESGAEFVRSGLLLNLEDLTVYKIIYGCVDR